jgi:hypothetical protein
MGLNVFVPFPVIPAMAGGPQASVDLLFFGPLDQDMTFVCKGEFDGVIAIEGSPDTGFGAQPIWNVIGQFEAGKDADGRLGPKLEFSPKKVDAVIRFVRANVHAIIASDTRISVGAEQNCACSFPNGDGGIIE